MAFVLTVGIASILAMGYSFNSSLENSYRVKKEREQRNLPRGQFPIPRDRIGKEDIFSYAKDFVQPGNCDLPSGGSTRLDRVSDSFDGYGFLGIPVKNIVKNDAYVEIYRPEVLFL